MNATACGCECPYADATFLRGVCGPSLAVFLGIVEMMLRDRCDIVQPCNRGAPDAFARRGHQDYDYVVVGAGVAGSVVAARLSEDEGRSVLLLEAGPEEPLASMVPAFAFNARDTHLDWRYETEPEKRACKNRGGRCLWPRGKMVAGTGAMQGMMYMRGSPAVFDAWERKGNPGWGYRDMLRYFLKAEGNRDMHLVEREYHSDQGPLAVQHFSHRPQLADDIVRAGNELLGLSVDHAGRVPHRDLNGRNQTGFVVAQMMQHRGLRGSTARMYLRPAMGRPNLVVNTHAHVSKVIIDASKGRAAAVEFFDKQGKKQRVRVRKEVVLCAGAVGSPHLLLLSGLGPTEDLEAVGVTPVADLPVGRNLHNHVAASVHYVAEDMVGRSGGDVDESDIDEVGPMSMAALHKYLDQRAGPMASTGLTQITGFVTTKFAEPGVPDVQYFFDGLNAGCESELQPPLRCAGPNATHSRGDYYDVQVDLDLDAAARSALRSSSSASRQDAKEGNVVVEGCPMLRRVAARPTALTVLSRGRLTLRSANPFDPPRIHANYFGHERDLLVLVEGMKMAARLADMPALRRWGFRLDTTPVVGCEHLAFASDLYWRCAAQRDTRPENHQTGSCCMGPAGDPDAVVDPELRVHGVPNLRVADASVMPIVPNANPISTIVVVAERAADLIKATWAAKPGKPNKPWGQ